LPREVEGFDTVEWLIIDDGSTDNTAEVARQNGVHHVIRHPVNRGLAEAFMTGIDACLKLDADVIVNTDADNQYNGADIPALTVPLLAGEAEIVIGARPISETEHFSWTKKMLQHLGSWAVRVASHTDVADAPSGFRAITREAAMRLNVFNAYTYTLEMIIQAGQSNMQVISVPIRTNADLRPSRLVRSIRSYVQRSLGTIVRVFVIYRPLALFLWTGIPCIAFGLLFGLRFLVLYLMGQGEGHIQSVVLAALCLIVGTLLIMMGLIADLIAANRKLSERILLHVQRVELEIDSHRNDDTVP
jgi:glycosyltransferase involved in cell wall biosynthesis